jgi:1,4-dihydroxy-2-naphthoate polyprenyltransferase
MAGRGATGTGQADVDVQLGLEKLTSYPFLVLTWIDAEGYPMSAAVDATADPDARVARFAAPAGLQVPRDRPVSLTGSHIRPTPGYGYDERRHVTVWGTIPHTGAGGTSEQVRPAGRPDELTLQADRAWGWDEAEIPFPEYAERGVGQSRQYFAELSAQLGREVRPRLSLGWLTLRATRLPFVSATLIPVLLGIAIAAADGFFDPWYALVTIVGAACVHLGLNVANDVFDTVSGADDINLNPTKYSGGSRVIQYGLVSIRRMAGISVAFYAVAALIGLYLLATRFSVPLLVIGVLGFIVSIGYTAPPLKLVYRGLGEIAVAAGFGPMMLLGAYVVQSRGTISPAAVVASLPVAILVALILYVNEVPDRRGDGLAGKRTLPVRLPRDVVINSYLVAALTAFGIVVAGVVAGLLPIPALAVLLALPLVPRVYGGLRQYYDQPYGLMAFMGVNIRLHLLVGAALLAAYALVLLASAFAPDVPLYVR